MSEYFEWVILYKKIKSMPANMMIVFLELRILLQTTINNVRKDIHIIFE